MVYLWNPKITLWLLQFILLGGTDRSIPISHWTGLSLIWLHTTVCAANLTQIHQNSYLNPAEKWPIPIDQVDKSVSDGVAKMATRIGVSLLQQPNSWVLRYNHWYTRSKLSTNFLFKTKYYAFLRSPHFLIVQHSSFALLASEGKRIGGIKKHDFSF